MADSGLGALDSGLKSGALSVAAANALHRAGLTETSALQALSHAELLRVRGIGRRLAAEVERWIATLPPLVEWANLAGRAMARVNDWGIVIAVEPSGACSVGLYRSFASEADAKAAAVAAARGK